MTDELSGFPAMMLSNAEAQVEQDQYVAGILLAQAAVETGRFGAIVATINVLLGFRPS